MKQNDYDEILDEDLENWNREIKKRDKCFIAIFVVAALVMLPWFIAMLRAM